MPLNRFVSIPRFLHFLNNGTGDLSDKLTNGISKMFFIICSTLLLQWPCSVIQNERQHETKISKGKY